MPRGERCGLEMDNSLDRGDGRRGSIFAKHDRGFIGIHRLTKPRAVIIHTILEDKSFTRSGM